MTARSQSKKELSRYGIQCLCKEYFDSQAKRIPFWKVESPSDRTVTAALNGRMDEIMRLVGQDTLDEYEERQRLFARIENLERRQNALEESLDHYMCGLILQSVATVCIGLSALIVFLVHL
jgi:hypothetical protein